MSNKGVRSVAGIRRQELIDLVQTVVEATVTELVERGKLVPLESVGLSVESKISPQSAFKMTSTLLSHYIEFREVIREREQTIKDILEHGLPMLNQEGCGTNIRHTKQIMDKAREELLVRDIRASVQGTVQMLHRIDKALATIEHDPFYPILDWLYKEGIAQEEIAQKMGCSQQCISINKTRLIKELSIKLFPDKVLQECLEELGD